MNALIKKEWVAALRSGKYKQGKRAMCCFKDKYTALGVLMDACFPVDWLADEHDECWRIENSAVFPPIRYTWAAGLTTVQEKTLMEMNDLHGKSFKEIATWIEKNL